MPFCFYQLLFCGAWVHSSSVESLSRASSFAFVKIKDENIVDAGASLITKTVSFTCFSTHTHTHTHSCSHIRWCMLIWQTCQHVTNKTACKALWSPHAVIHKTFILKLTISSFSKQLLNIDMGYFFNNYPVDELHLLEDECDMGDKVKTDFWIFFSIWWDVDDRSLFSVVNRFTFVLKQ